MFFTIFYRSCKLLAYRKRYEFLMKPQKVFRDTPQTARITCGNQQVKNIVIHGLVNDLCFYTNGGHSLWTSRQQFLCNNQSFFISNIKGLQCKKDAYNNCKYN
jgi:phosphatidate phosphatase PAH1